MNINLIDVIASKRGIAVDSPEYEELKLNLMELTGLHEQELDVPLPSRAERRVPEWVDEAVKVAKEFCQTSTPEQVEFYRSLLFVASFPRFYNDEAIGVYALFDQVKPLLAEAGNELLYNRLRNVLRVPRERMKLSKNSRAIRKETQLILNEPEPTEPAVEEPPANVLTLTPTFKGKTAKSAAPSEPKAELDLVQF